MTPTTGQSGFAQLSGGDRFLAGKVTALLQNQTCRASARRENGYRAHRAPGVCWRVTTTEWYLSDPNNSVLSQRFWNRTGVNAR
jgi:hypothetical protein